MAIYILGGNYRIFVPDYVLSERPYTRGNRCLRAALLPSGVLLQEQPVTCVHTHVFRHTQNALLRVLGTQAWTTVFSLRCPWHEASTWWSVLSSQAPASHCILSFERIRLFLNLVYVYLSQRRLPDPER